MDGVELATKIREIDYQCDDKLKTFIIGMSANRDSETENEVRMAGMSAFLEKPVSGIQIVQEIEAWYKNTEGPFEYVL